ncbi:uncharacterized protein LOC120667293 isoform X2 [Panicum virgatum]|uniref:uncharacterized protein LOC120667293 isoform X2 n=1 Tax=Panicum virgatum TaxID=38727 RepID=UPI0019D54882|nr:uncharacterized protein LOC120667293 isoform X2 [Panicum virgatum]
MAFKAKYKQHLRSSAGRTADGGGGGHGAAGATPQNSPRQGPLPLPRRSPSPLDVECKMPRYNEHCNHDYHNSDTSSRTKLYVGSISTDAREQDLEAAFSIYGRVQRVCTPITMDLLCFMNHRMQMLQGVILTAKNFLGVASVLSLQKSTKSPDTTTTVIMITMVNKVVTPSCSWATFPEISRNIILKAYSAYMGECATCISSGNLPSLSSMIPMMHIMQGANLMLKNLVGVLSLLSLQLGLRAVQAVLLLSAAITVGHMGTSLMIAKLVTGKIGATHVEKAATSAKTTGTVIMTSGGSTVLVVKNCSQEAPVTVAALGVPYHGQGRKLNTVVHVMMTTDTLFPMAKAMMKHD